MYGSMMKMQHIAFRRTLCCSHIQPLEVEVEIGLRELVPGSAGSGARLGDRLDLLSDEVVAEQHTRNIQFLALNIRRKLPNLLLLVTAIFGQVMAFYVVTQLAKLDFQAEPIVNLNLDHYCVLHHLLEHEELIYWLLLPPFQFMRPKMLSASSIL